jgi:predicted lipid-binding transport protein (Tim44 family)
MENFDILIYAAIAAFLLVRLWSVLGQKDEDEPPVSERPNPFSSKEDKNADEENVMVIEGRAKALKSEALTQQGHARTSLAGILDQIRNEDPTFNEKSFIEGAKKAFAEIVTAFAKGDLSKVKRFLGPSVSEPFEDAIKTREESGKRLENKIDRIVAADIVAARREDTAAILTVEFVSYQINQFLDKEEDAPFQAKTEEVRDMWVFRRDLKAEDPNWLLIETLS